MKQFNDDVTLANCDITIVVFRFLANFEQSGSRIPDTGFVKLAFSLTVLEKLKTKLKNLFE